MGASLAAGSALWTSISKLAKILEKGGMRAERGAAGAGSGRSGEGLPMGVFSRRILGERRDGGRVDV